MPAVTGDVTAYGFGSCSGSFAAPGSQFARIIRVIPASLARVDITNIDVGLELSAAPAAQRALGVGVSVWRTSLGAGSSGSGGSANPTPPFVGLVPVVGANQQAGFEFLWGQSVFANFTTPSTAADRMSQNSFTFRPRVLFADAGKQLLIVCTQPISADGAAQVAGFSWLSVLGIDNAENIVNSVRPREASLPRFDVRFPAGE